MTDSEKKKVVDYEHLEKYTQYINSLVVEQSSGLNIDTSQPAEVGQILSVKEIDDDGKPTKWKTSADGLMSSADKTKLDGIASGATANTGTVTSVKVQGSNGISGSGTVTTTGTITLSNSGVRSITQDSSDGHKLTINTGGTNTTITIPDNNTTYSSKTAASGGTDVSLCTTGEKYEWNNKFSLAEGNILKNMYIGAGVSNNGKSYTISNDKIYMLTLQSGTNSAIYLAYASSNTAKVACVVNNGMSGITVSASGLTINISASSWYAFSFTALAR